MNTTKAWICDTCGQPINAPKDGWVEWLIRPCDSSNTKWTGRGLRLVHHFTASTRTFESRCQYHERTENARDGSHINDLSLEDFLGADGLMELLSFIARGELPTSEVLEMIKRLHIPGYEHARFYFDRAVAEGEFEPNTLEGFYSQSNIAATLEFMGRQSD